MSRFDDRLTRGFDEIAERVSPSSSALADFRSRVAQHTPHDEEEVVIVMTPDNLQPRRPRWVALAIVGASAAFVLALVGIVLLRSEADDMMPSATTAETPTRPSETVPPTTDAGGVLPSVDDDLCEWFTMSDMNTIVDRAQARAGTGFSFAPFDDDSLCESGMIQESGEFRAYWSSRSFPMFDDHADPHVVSRPEGREIRVSIALTDYLLDADGFEPFGYRAHPMLDESVHYQDGGAPVVLSSDLWVGGGPFVRFDFDVHDPDETKIDAYHDVGFAIANEMLSEMGWIDQAPPVATFEVLSSNVRDGEDGPCGRFTVSELNAIIERAQAKAGTSFASAHFGRSSLCEESVPYSETAVHVHWISRETGDMGLFRASIRVEDDPPDADGSERGHPMLDESMPYWVGGYGERSSVETSAALQPGDGPRVALRLTVHDPEVAEALDDPEAGQKWNDRDTWAHRDAWSDPDFRPITEPYEAFALALANAIAIEFGWID